MKINGPRQGRGDLPENCACNTIAEVLDKDCCLLLERQAVILQELIDSLESRGDPDAAFAEGKLGPAEIKSERGMAWREYPGHFLGFYAEDIDALRQRIGKAEHELIALGEVLMTLVGLSHLSKINVLRALHDSLGDRDPPSSAEIDRIIKRYEKE